MSRKTCRGRFSLNRTLPLVYSPALGAVTPSHRRCVNYIGCQFRDEWSSSLPVLCTSHWHQRRRRTSLSTFDSSLSMVVVLCVDLPTVASPGVRGRGHCISNIRVGRQNRLVMCGPPSTTPAAGKFSQRICHVLRVQFGDSCVWVGSNCLRLPPPRGDTTAFEQDARCSTETQVFGVMPAMVWTPMWSYLSVTKLYHALTKAHDEITTLWVGYTKPGHSVPDNSLLYYFIMSTTARADPGAIVSTTFHFSVSLSFSFLLHFKRVLSFRGRTCPEFHGDAPAVDNGMFVSPINQHPQSPPVIPIFVPSLAHPGLWIHRKGSTEYQAKVPPKATLSAYNVRAMATWFQRSRTPQTSSDVDLHGKKQCRGQGRLKV